MARNISISVSVQDQYSQSISSMREKTVAFNKDIEELTAKIKSLNKEKISLNIDAVKAQQTLRDLQQQFKSTGNAADQMVLQLANANYSNVNKQIERISKSTQDARKELSNFVFHIPDFSQTNQTNPLNIQSNNSGSDNSAILSAFATTPEGAVAVALAEKGEDVKEFLFDFFASDLNDYYELRNQFPQFVKNQLSSYLTKNNEDLDMGLSISSNRRINGNALNAFFANSQEAEKFIGDLKSLSNKVPFSYEQLLSMYSALNQSGNTPDENFNTLQTLTNLNGKIGVDSADIIALTSQLAEMRATDKISIEALDYLTKYGIDIFQELADKKGISEEAVKTQISNGDIKGSEISDSAIQVLQDTQYNTSTSAAELTNMNTDFSSYDYDELSIINQNQNNNLKEAMARGYENERAIGLQRHAEWMSSETGQKLEQIYEAKGRLIAKQENDAEESSDLMWEAIINGPTEEQNYANPSLEGMHNLYVEGSDESLYSIAAAQQTAAYSDYMQSEGAQSFFNAQIAAVNMIQNIAANDDSFLGGWTAVGAEAGRSYGSGFNSGVNQTINFFTGLGSILGVLPEGMEATFGTPQFSNDEKKVGVGLTGGGGDGKGGGGVRPSAFGLERVPYDNYPALLHQGEQVLTAQQVRQQKNIPSVTVTGNQFVIREEADITKLAKAFVAEMQKAYAIT